MADMNITNSLLQATARLRRKLTVAHYNQFASKEGVAKLQGAYSGQPMLIVGNGPSLNRTPLDDFSHVASIGMNKIDLIYDRTSWRPSLVVCCNQLVVAQHWQQLTSTDIPAFISWKTRRRMPKAARKTANYFVERPTMDFSEDLTAGVGTCPTVTYACLQFAYYMGADPVVLVGVDHSFNTSQSGANKVERRQGADMNHFDPNYFSSASLWQLPDLDKSELAYSLARQAFEKDGRRVYDATIGGKLTIFPRIEIEEAMDMTRDPKRVAS